MSNTGHDCPFCDDLAPRGECDWCLEHAVALYDKYPVTEGHVLILPRHHITRFDDLTPDAMIDMARLVIRVRRHLKSKYPEVTGFNLGMNVGRSAGQTQEHLHMHVIPRRDDDHPNPAGGVRAVIPWKCLY